MEHFGPRADLVPHTARPGVPCQPRAKKAQKPKDTPRQALCRELLEIRRDNLTIFTRIEAINTRLKKLAGDEGKFREAFDELGHVSVSPPTPEQVTGEAPVLQIEVWQALRDSRRDKLLEEGLVEVKSIIKRATYGQVRVKLHAEPEGED
ncbi:hypothetical protein ACVWW6_006007 [Bradyrhizobium sp. USDA 3311]